MNESNEGGLAGIGFGIPAISGIASTCSGIDFKSIAVGNSRALNLAVEEGGVPYGVVPASAGAQRSQDSEGVWQTRAVNLALCS